MKKIVVSFLCCCILTFSNVPFVYAAENDYVIFRKKIENASNKEKQVKATEKLEEMKKSGSMPYFIEAQDFAGKGSFTEAAKVLDNAAHLFPKSYEPLIRWRSIYHYKAGEFEDVVFILKDYVNKPLLYSYFLSSSYRQIGAYEKAKKELITAELKLPQEIKVPVVPPAIQTLDNADQEHIWLGAALLYAEKAIHGYSQLNESKDIGTIIQVLDSFWRCVPRGSDQRTLPIQDFYGVDLIDISLVTGFILVADGEFTDAANALSFYVKNKKPISSLDRRFLEEANILLEQMSPGMEAAEK